MKQIKLQSMHVERFKGLFSFDISFGEHTEVSGRNALGKTCIYDAYLWCLFNKDSRGRVIDKVQTMDANGATDKDARTIVTVSFLIDGQKVEFRREFYQSWSKKRGTTEYVYNGNASDYFYNDVPLTLTDYNKQLQECFDKDRFELVSNINLFASFDTAKRRGILEEIADIESLTKLIASEYPSVCEAIAAGKSVEMYQAELRKRLLKVKDEADDIPVRIDEVERRIPDAPDCESLLERKKKLTEEQEAHQKTVDEYRKAAIVGADSSLKKELNAVNDRISDISREAALAMNKETNAAKDASYARESELSTAKRKQSGINQELTVALTHHNTALDEFNKLRSDWTSVNETEYKASEPLTSCPTCGHVFTAEELAENEGRAVKIFNHDKLDRLEKLEQEAQRVKKRVDDYDSQVKQLKASLENAEKDVARLNAAINAEAKSAPHIKTIAERLEGNEEYSSLIARRDELTARIASQQPVTYADEIQHEKDEILRISTEIGSINKELAKEDQIKNARARIEQLNEQGRALGQERADIEQKLDEISEFGRRKMNAIEDRINGLFQYVKIRMFESNLTNDGVKDICDITVDGIPYSVLNTAGRINAGIDICRTLAMAYGMSAPIWVDNVESVNSILGGNCQLITLRVTEEDTLTTNQIV